MVAKYDGDQQFEEFLLTKIPGSVPLGFEIRTSVLKSVWNDLTLSIGRVAAIAHFITDLTGYAYMLGRAHRAGFHAVGVEPTWPPYPPEKMADFSKAVAADFERQDLYSAPEGTERNADTRKYHRIKLTLEAMHDVDSKFVPTFERKDHEYDQMYPFRVGVEVTLSTLLLIGWTAFEAFLVDLWVVAVNAYPSKTLAIYAKNVDKDELKIDFGQINRRGFDLRGSMGEILKDKNKFTNLDGAMAAYRRAFGKDKVDTLFELHKASLYTAQALRNVLMHKGGKVDDKFKERVQDSALKSLAVGQAVHLNGADVRSNLEALGAFSEGLLKLVDDFLTPPASSGTG